MEHFEWSCFDKLRRFEEQLDAIAKSEFIRDSTLNALNAIRAEVSKLRTDLKTAARLKDERFFWPIGVTINQKVFNLTNSLGILLRSTNLRNCFEAYYAFEEMIRYLVGERDVLIISSEWDASPFYIPKPPDVLRNFVFIGLPTFISRNALFLPLTAHEIGHAIWWRQEIDGKLSITADFKLREEVDKKQAEFDQDFGVKGDIFEISRREDAFGECLDVISSQAEEIFCDLLGSQLFGRSFAFAFDFHLSPGTGKRESLYPSFASRSQYIRADALSNDDAKKHPYILGPAKILASSPQSSSRYIKWTDPVTESLIPAIRGEVQKALAKLPKPNRSLQCDRQISRSFSNLTPPDRPRSLPDILNAAWDMLLDKTSKVSSLKEKESIMTNMNHLCIKALEVYEHKKAFGAKKKDRPHDSSSRVTTGDKKRKQR